MNELAEEYEKQKSDKTQKWHPIVLVEASTLKSVFKHSGLGEYYEFYTDHRETIELLSELPAYDVKLNELLIENTNTIYDDPKRTVKDHYILKLSKLLYYLSRLIVGEDGELFENYVCALEEKIARANERYIDIRLVCKTSKPTFTRLTNDGVKSIVFASGTINKKQFTKEETGLDLSHAYYPNKSLFSKENITTFVVPAYGNQRLQLRGRDITDKTTNTSEPQYNKDEVISIIDRLTREGSIPHGVLVFFKSYAHLRAMREEIVSR